MAYAPTPDDREEFRRRPEGRPVMYQNWSKLLFLHWRMDPAEIQATLPEGLTVDTFEGDAWLGLVPFFMKGIRPRGLPSVPGISNFLEMNVRTYVFDSAGRPGVWFYSLDANQSLAVAIAQRFFHLPYFRADMSAQQEKGVIHYSCQRRGEPSEAESNFVWRAGNSLPAPEQGSLEYFLVERYLLFSHRERDGQLFCGRVHHSPYALLEALIEEYTDGATSLAGFNIGDRRPDHAVYSSNLDVDVFGITSASAS